VGKVPSHRVLLIDDSPITLKIAASVLQHSGYDVRVCTDFQDLRRVLGSWRPDVILTDVNMPGLTGVELCRRLKASYETADVPIVLFSSLSIEELESLARDCEADGFLSKGNGLDELAGAVELLIDSTHL